MKVKPWALLPYQYDTPYEPHNDNTLNVWMAYMEGDHGVFKSIIKTDNPEKEDSWRKHSEQIRASHGRD